MSQKNVTLFIFVITQSDVIQFCQFLAEIYPREFETKHIFRVHHISLYMFALYLVKTSNDFYGIPYSVKHKVSSLHIKVHWIQVGTIQVLGNEVRCRMDQKCHRVTSTVSNSEAGPRLTKH